MSNPEDNRRQETGPLSGRPRRQPPTIDVKAVEVSLDGKRAAAAGSSMIGSLTAMARSLKRMLATLSSVKFGVISSVCVIAVVAAGAFWVYLTPDDVDEPKRNVATREVKPDDVIGRGADPETIPQASSPTAAPGADLANRVAALEAMLAPLPDRMAELARDVRDNATAARIAGERAAGLFDKMKLSGDEQISLQQQERSTLENLAERLKLLESREVALQRKQEELDRVANAMVAPDKTIRLVIIAAALRTAVERSDPFTVELATARSLGLDEKTLAPLEPFAATGVPTQNELLRSLSALVPELLRLSVPPDRELSYLERLQASAIKMMNIRPVRDEPGDDPSTVIGRIEFKIMQQDLAGVVSELDKLPAPAKGLAQPWRAKAMGRQNAIESTRLIATASLAKLGEPGARGPSPQ